MRIQVILFQVFLRVFLSWTTAFDVLLFNEAQVLITGYFASRDCFLPFSCHQQTHSSEEHKDVHLKPFLELFIWKTREIIKSYFHSIFWTKLNYWNKTKIFFTLSSIYRRVNDLGLQLFQSNAAVFAKRFFSFEVSSRIASAE